MINIKNLTIKIISKKEAKDLISAYHYLWDKGFRSGKNFGLFLCDELIGCAVYHSVSAPETVVGAFGLDRCQQDGFLELGRLVLKPEYNGGNLGSILVGRSLRELKKDKIKAVISYASSDIHVGYIYQATNWGYYGTTDQKKDFFADLGGVLSKQERGRTKGVAGVWVNRPIKHRYMFIFDKGLRPLWVKQEYPKGGSAVSCCYGCEGVGTVLDRRYDKEYNCPICN